MHLSEQQSSGWGNSQADVVRDDLALNLVGTAIDRRSERATHLALHAVLAGVAVTTHHLHGLECRVLRDLGASHLGHGAFPREIVLEAGIDLGRDIVDEHPGEFDVGGQISDAVSQRLEGADRPAELLTLPRVGDDVVECSTAPPMLMAAMIIRSMLRPRMSCFHALQGSPTTAEAGTSTSVKNTSLQVRASIVSIPRMVNPGASVGTISSVKP